MAANKNATCDSQPAIPSSFRFAASITNSNNESVNSPSLLRFHRRCTLSLSLGSLTSYSQSWSSFHHQTPSVSGFPTPPIPVTSRSLFVCTAECELPASLLKKKKKKKNYMTQGQRKGQDRLWLTFPTQVTICFRGILLCDSQSIKQHIPTHSATFLHPQGHSYPWVIISVADKQPHMSYCPPFSVRRSHRIFYLKLQCVGTGIPPWGIIRICQETKAVT